MFECKACVMRCIRAFTADAQISQTFLKRPPVLTHPLAHHTSRRAISTGNTSIQGRNVKRNGARSATGVHPQGREPEEPFKTPSVREERALQMEMQYLKDPVKFADHVHYVLRNNTPLKALRLCRLASKNMNCVVAWNHTVDWYMKRGQVNTAIRVYNEMKKRAQFPDSYTYLLLLRGFPQYRTHEGEEVKKDVVAKALSIYDSMSKSTSKVKPTIMHTNAILRVCSLAGDMDALWRVVGQLPEQGPDSADYVTYTILLSAIRHAALREGLDISAQESVQARNRAVDEGRRIWQDIIARWRGGEILIDEELVCTMGNLLLISKRLQDWDDVLNLVQQTTNIPRQLAPLGAAGRHTEHVPVLQKMEEQTGISSTEDPEGWTLTPATDVFKAVDSQQSGSPTSRKPASHAWVQPGNAILSVVMDACTSMRATKAVTLYWDLFTSDYSLIPDRPNYQALFRLLRTNRNSAKAASIMQDMHKQGVELRNQTFRLALSVCLRSNDYAHVLSHAESIVEVMFRVQREPDLHTLESYLDLATRIKDGSHISGLLGRITPTIDALRARVDSDSKPYQAEIDATNIFFRSVIGAIDTLCRDESVPEADVERWKAKRSELDSIIGHTANSFEHQRQSIHAQKESTDRYTHHNRDMQRRSYADRDCRTQNRKGIFSGSRSTQATERSKGSHQRRVGRLRTGEGRANGDPVNV